MTTQKITDNNASDYLVKFYPCKTIGLDYIKEYYSEQTKSFELLQWYYEYANQHYSQMEVVLYENLLRNFPFLGNFTKKHSFREKPLYRYLNPTEPQLTKALSNFLLENPKSCQAFLQTIFSLLNKNIKLPENGYRCLCEVITCDVHSKNKRFKRIDNVILWKDGALCIEVKFDAVIDDNDLKIYEQQMNKMAGDKNNTYVAISIDDIRETIKRKQCNKWQNLRWYDVLRLWEEIIYCNNVCESEDMRRYRSSLWNKVLY